MRLRTQHDGEEGDRGSRGGHQAGCVLTRLSDRIPALRLCSGLDHILKPVFKVSGSSVLPV